MMKKNMKVQNKNTLEVVDLVVVEESEKGVRDDTGRVYDWGHWQNVDRKDEQPKGLLEGHSLFGDG